jgi:uncharacterized membrane protein YfcA
VNQNTPIINHAVAAVMEPMTLVGTVFGVMLNKTLPNWAILALLIALLATITYKTAVKGFKVRPDRYCGAALFQRLSLYAVP